MRGKINYRLLVACLVALAFATVVWFFAHRYQKRRAVGEYLVQATRAEEDKKLDRAARLLRAYILAVPADADAKFRYAGLLEKMGTTAKFKSDALFVYEQVVRLAPERLDARRRAAELAVELSRIGDAERHLTALTEALPNDGRALYLFGLCQESKGQFDRAEKTYERSYKVDPKPEAYVRRAGVLRTNLKREDGTDADGKETGPQAVLNEMVAALPNAPEAYLARAAYHNSYTKGTGPARARADLEMARKLAPKEPLVLLASAQICVDLAGQEKGTTEPARTAREALWAEARGYLTAAVEAAPKDPRPALALADLEDRAGRREEALKVLTAAHKRVAANGRAAVLYEMAELHAETGDVATTDAVLAQAKQLNDDRRRAELIGGTARARAGQWNDAAGRLVLARDLYTGTPGTVARINTLLALCYGNLGDIDNQLITYNQAVAADPNDPRARFGRANALAALGRTREAVEDYRHLTLMERSPAAAWLALARLLVYEKLSSPADQRVWGEPEGLIAAAKKVVPDAVEVPLLEAEVLAAKGDRAGAQKVLAAARDARPKEPAFWFALATLIDRAGDNSGAHRLLDDAQKQLGDTADLRAARLRVTTYTNAEQAAGVLTGLSADLERFPPEERVRLLRALASAYWAIDRPADAARLWDQVAALRPNELGCRLLRFDAALKLNDDAGTARVLDEIGKIERNGPLTMYGSAVRHIWRAERGDRSGLTDARGLLATAASRRPSWARVPLALARIDELEGNEDQLLEHLKQAVLLGDRQLSVLRRLTRLLDERKRAGEADELFRRLDTQAPLSGEQLQLHAEAVLPFDVERALELARKAVRNNTSDFRERLWLGRILSAAARAAETSKRPDLAKARRAEAVGTFEAAAKLAADKGEVWVAYLSFVAREIRDGRGDRAQQADLLKRAEAALGATDPLAVAVCYEIAADRDAAEIRYLAALKAKSADARAVRAVATFYQQSGRPEKAEPFLRQLVGPDLKAPADQVAWARRNLALALGLRPDGSGVGEALRLLDENAKAGAQADDLRARAMIRATQPDGRREVIGLLERAETMRPPAPEHEFLLAGLYEAEGDWPKARARLIALAGSQRGTTRYIEALARGLLRHGERNEASNWSLRLIDLAPDARGAVAVRTQVLCQEGQPARALALIDGYAAAKGGTPADPAARALAAAELYELVYWCGGGKEALAAAERHFAKHRAESKGPDGALQLAAFLGRADAPDRALAVCAEALAAGATLEPVIYAGLSAVSGPSARDPHFATVEGWIAKARAAKPDAIDLTFLVGTLREQQKRYPEAEAEYAKVLARVPAHAGALNNLAFLRSMSGKGKEAVQVAERAVAAVKAPPPELLDTRAVALTEAGDLAAAKRDLEAALAADGPAVAHFHLARVHYKLNDRAKATEALRAARCAGMRLTALHPLERPKYDELVAELRP